MKISFFITFIKNVCQWCMNRNSPPLQGLNKNAIPPPWSKIIPTLPQFFQPTPVLNGCPLRQESWWKLSKLTSHHPKKNIALKSTDYPLNWLRISTSKQLEKCQKLDHSHSKNWLTPYLPQGTLSRAVEIGTQNIRFYHVICNNEGSFSQVQLVVPGYKWSDTECTSSNICYVLLLRHNINNQNIY